MCRVFTGTSVNVDKRIGSASDLVNLSRRVKPYCVPVTIATSMFIGNVVVVVKRLCQLVFNVRPRVPLVVDGGAIRLVHWIWLRRDRMN